MPYAINALDGRRVYFEDDGGTGAPVLAYGGALDTVELVRGSELARALRASDEFRVVVADHRGLGRSDKPHDMEAYALQLQVADALGVLDELGVDQAHVIGQSYGGRLAFGIAEHAPERVRSLVVGGQQPYAVDPAGPVARAVLSALESTRTEGVEALVEAFERHWQVRFPEAERRAYLAQDGAAVAAASEAMLDQGPISRDLRAWTVPCLLFVGEDDADFVAQVRKAADEIPGAELVVLADRDHYGAHSQTEVLLPAVFRLLRGAA